MGEIKSAFEKALEKAERLGKLSAEEMRRQAKAGKATAGRALAKRYLEHGSTKILEDEIEKHTAGDAGTAALEAAISVLIEAMDPFDESLPSTIERIIEGLRVLSGEKQSAVDEFGERIKHALTDFRGECERTFQSETRNIEINERRALEQMGIWGSAVGEINLKAGGTWAGIEGEMRSALASRLEPFKRGLSEALTGH